MSSSGSIAVSAPGKVLLAGGYLVVDRAYTGLVFGLSARIHVHIKRLKTVHSMAVSEVVVRSPQFRGAVWRYGYRQSEGQQGVEVVQLKDSSTSEQPRNKFVETALTYAFNYVSCLYYARIQPATVTILADSDYYSNVGKMKSGSRFEDFEVDLSAAHKTGLGSSAALVTALIGAVLKHYLPCEDFDERSEQGKKRIHNLAQAAHCAAQGKIGSGFDVAAAVYGPCIYRRFSPSVLEKVSDPGSCRFAEQLFALVNDDDGEIWDTEIQTSALDMPKMLRLVMCDVDCGSETPGMVKKVFVWREGDRKDADRLWGELQRSNEDLATALKELAYESNPNLQILKNTMHQIRARIREMSQKAGVPIEPPEQSHLIEHCCSVEGVIGGVVPGAGGYDALALIVENKAEVIQRLERALDSYIPKEEPEGPTIGKVRLLGVTQELEGIRSEDLTLYNGWLTQ